MRKHRLAAAITANYALLMIANLKALGEELNPGYGPLTKWAAKHREWLAKEEKKVGKPIPRYRATPSEINYLVAKSLAKRAPRCSAWLHKNAGCLGEQPAFSRGPHQEVLILQPRTFCIWDKKCQSPEKGPSRGPFHPLR